MLKIWYWKSEIPGTTENSCLNPHIRAPHQQSVSETQRVEYKTVRSGFCAEGVPSNIDIVKSLQGSIARRIAMTSSKRKQLKALEEKLDDLCKDKHDHIQEERALAEEISILKNKINKVPFIDTFDLHFRNYAKQALPYSKAVMFCLMDVSGSMDQATKEMAKRFYILLYLFLSRTYKNIDI